MKRIRMLAACTLGVGILMAGTASAEDLPPCPEVIYDGVLPQDGGTGPIWSTPDGLPPTYDCNGPGYVNLAEVPEIIPELEVMPEVVIITAAPTAAPEVTLPAAEVMEVDQVPPTMSALMEEWMRINPLP